MPLNGMKEKSIPSTGHRALEGVQKEFIAELRRLHPQIPSPKTMKSLNPNHRRKKGLPSLIQATRIELLYLK